MGFVTCSLRLPSGLRSLNTGGSMAKVVDVKKSEIQEVTLVLTGREAEVLRSILGLVGGNPDGPRGSADNIRTALTEAGVGDPVRRTGEITLFS